MDLPYTLRRGRPRCRGSRRLHPWRSPGTTGPGPAPTAICLRRASVGVAQHARASLGGEMVRATSAGPTMLPIRLGIRYADLPFPVVDRQHPKEFGISAGTGTRFAAGPGGRRSVARTGVAKRGIALQGARPHDSFRAVDPALRCEPRRALHEARLHRNLRLPDERGRHRAHARRLRPRRATSRSRRPTAPTSCW